MSTPEPSPPSLPRLSLLSFLETALSWVGREMDRRLPSGIVPGLALDHREARGLSDPIPSLAP